MKTIAEYEVKFPSWALSYVINGDDSGITPEDKRLVDSYMSRFPAGAIVDYEAEAGEYFTWCPEFGLACDVVDAHIIVLAPEDLAGNIREGLG